jgi:uncharacterized membrane protein YoaK (UPF0700 family)
VASFDPQPVNVPRRVMVALGFVAGFIDACTFLALFHLFVAQVTGSFVLAGTQAVEADPRALVPILAIPVFFLAGLLLALWIVGRGWRGYAALAAALLVEGALVLGFFAAMMIGSPFTHPNDPLAAAAGLLGIASMGVQSATVRLLLRGAPSTNVMTTNTTQLAIDTAEWLVAWGRRHRHPRSATDRSEYAVARRRLVSLFMTMAGFFAGTICGALGYWLAGAPCLVAALAVLAGVIAFCLRRARN